MEKNTTTSELVKKEIQSSLFLQEILKRGLINYSALARNILEKIKKENPKAKFASVLIAIQRYYDEIRKEKKSDAIKDLLDDSELIMKNSIVSLTIERTKKSVSIINDISKEIRWDMGDIMFIIQGNAEITIIIDKKNKKKFNKLNKLTIEEKENLALLSLREASESNSYSRDTPGFLGLLTTSLSDKNINILDIASTYKQTFFLLNKKDLPNAYKTLNNLIEN